MLRWLFRIRWPRRLTWDDDPLLSEDPGGQW